MRHIFFSLFMLLAHAVGAQEVIDLWQGEAPYSKPTSLEEYVKESWGVPCVHNVTHPTLTVYPAQGENSGRPMTPEELRQYDLAGNVSARTPPAFLAHAYDDEVVPIGDSERYAAALAAAGRDVEVHFFANGGHGFGPGRRADGTDQWLGLLADWIKRQ